MIKLTDNVGSIWIVANDVVAVRQIFRSAPNESERVAANICQSKVFLRHGHNFEVIESAERVHFIVADYLRLHSPNTL